MKGSPDKKTLCTAAFMFAAVLGSHLPSLAQNAAYERSFPQSKAAVEKALQQLQSSMSGRLPGLEGFAVPGDHALSSYRRGFYQATAQVTANAAGGTSVRITTKVTAWYADSVATHSGYQLLTSNGRLEADLLDQLSDQLSSGAPSEPVKAQDHPKVQEQPAVAATKPEKKEPSASGISAPMPRLPDSGGTFSSSLSRSLADSSRKKTEDASSALAEGDSALQAEAASLEEILKNQAHPKNLVAVKKSGTPVVATPGLSVKPMFYASAHDEFEMLDFNRDWVHVRISGLSRGWIWRTSLEMPDSVPDTDAPSATAPSPAAEMFQVSRQETAPFPGDWEPLRGKNVKIVSVEKTDDSGKEEGPQMKLEFAKSVLDQNYNDVAQKTSALAGIVIIFDSADGGMIAATLPTLQAWKAGRLSDAALWHQCFFDPPETFVPSGATASR